MEPVAAMSWPMLAKVQLMKAAKKVLGRKPSINSVTTIARPNSYLMIFRKPPNDIDAWIPHKALL